MPECLANKEIQIFRSSLPTLRHSYHQGRWTILQALNQVNQIGVCKVKSLINTLCLLVLLIDNKTNL